MKNPRNAHQDMTRRQFFNAASGGILLLSTSVGILGCDGHNKRSETLGGSADIVASTRLIDRISPYIAIAVTDDHGTGDFFKFISTRGAAERSSSVTSIVDASSSSSYSSASSSEVSSATGGTCLRFETTVVEGVVTVTALSRFTDTDDRPPIIRGIAVGFDEASALRDGLSEADLLAARGAVEAVAAVLAGPEESYGEPGHVGRAAVYWILVAGRTVAIASWMHNWFWSMADPQDNPHKNVYNNPRFSHSDDTTRHLFKNGFHRVPAYASWKNYGSNFAYYENMSGRPMQLRHAPYKAGAYRTEAGLRLLENAPRSTYYIQSREPNPEIFRYDNPTWWWSLYTFWWHQLGPGR